MNRLQRDARVALAASLEAQRKAKQENDRITKEKHHENRAPAPRPAPVLRPRRS